MSQKQNSAQGVNHTYRNHSNLADQRRGGGYAEWQYHKLLESPHGCAERIYRIYHEVRNEETGKGSMAMGEESWPCRRQQPPVGLLMFGSRGPLFVPS